MRRALASTLLLVLLGITLLPSLLAARVPHDCCAPKAQQHCPDHDGSASIAAGACSWSHHCCTWLAGKQAARPGAATRIVAAAVRVHSYPFHGVPGFAPLVIEDHSGRSPPPSSCMLFYS